MTTEQSAPEPQTLPLAAAEDTNEHAARERRGVVSSAGTIMVGTLLSSVCGMIRLETVNTIFYGVASGAFSIALRPIQQVSDLLVGGSVSGALIPTFVDYSAPEKRAELRHVYSTITNLVLILMTVGCLALFFGAPYFIPFETQKVSPEGQQLTIRLVQIAAFSLFGLGLYAVGSALLYALKEVKAAAFSTWAYHVGIVVCGVLVAVWAATQSGVPVSQLLHPNAANPLVEQARLQGAQGLAIGAALGALGEFLILVPTIRRVLRVWKPVLDLRHPAVRQILRLYAPLVFGLMLSVVVQNVDVTLIGLTPGDPLKNASSLVTGVALVQLPIGLVSAALSFSILPLLVPSANRGDYVAFKRTLNLGFRLGLLLMVPAMVVLVTLAWPVASVLFQHGTCDHGCTYRNTLAISTLAVQLPFIALDQLLIAAYFARKNTLLPTLVGVASAGVYALVAVPLAPRIGLPGITWANTAQNSSHAVLLFILLTFAIGDLRFRELVGGLARLAVAAALMAGVCLAAVYGFPQLDPTLFARDNVGGQAITLLVGVVAGGLVYFGAAWLLRMEELRMVGGMVRGRLGRRA